MSKSRKPALRRIAPDGFIDAYDADSFEDALRRAELAASSTPKADRPRCRFCRSVRLRQKHDSYEVDHKRPERWYCTNCSRHVSEVMPPLSDLDVDEYPPIWWADLVGADP